MLSACLESDLVHYTDCYDGAVYFSDIKIAYPIIVESIDGGMFAVKVNGRYLRNGLRNVIEFNNRQEAAEYGHEYIERRLNLENLALELLKTR